MRMVMTHQDTAGFSLTEREMMADAIRSEAKRIEVETTRWNLTHQTPLDADIRVLRYRKIGALRSLANELEHGERR